jgi:hypothetical protein
VNQQAHTVSARGEVSVSGVMRAAQQQTKSPWYCLSATWPARPERRGGEHNEAPTRHWGVLRSGLRTVSLPFSLPRLGVKSPVGDRQHPCETSANGHITRVGP